MAARVKTESAARRREALREALIEAAQRRIAADGYAALRARDLAEDVGCALGAIYLVFPDLDSIIVAVKDRTLAALEAEAASASASGGAADNLVRLGAVYLDFARRNRNLWRALFEHRAPDHVPSGAARAMDAIFAHVERQVARLAPRLEGCRRRLLAEAFFGAAHGIVALGLNDLVERPSEEEVGWQARAIVSLAADGLMSAGDAPD